MPKICYSLSINKLVQPKTKDSLNKAEMNMKRAIIAIRNQEVSSYLLEYGFSIVGQAEKQFGCSHTHCNDSRCCGRPCLNCWVGKIPVILMRRPEGMSRREQASLIFNFRERQKETQKELKNAFRPSK
jgi:hypothetical protein